MKQLSGKLFLVVAVMAVVLLGMVMLCWSWYSSRRTEALRRHEGAMAVFDQQVQASIRNILQVFATTAKPGRLFDLFAVDKSELFEVRRRAITRAAAGSPDPIRCRLGFETEGDPALVLEYAGLARNARGENEKLWLDLVSDIGSLSKRLDLVNDIGSRGGRSAEPDHTALDALLIADEDNVVFFQKGEVGEAGIKLEQILDAGDRELFSRAAAKSDGPGTGGSPHTGNSVDVTAAGREYVAFPREIPLDTAALSRAPGTRRRMLDAVLQSCDPTRRRPRDEGDESLLAPKVTLRAVGLMRAERVRKEALQLPLHPLVIGLFLLLLLLFALPFLKLFTLKPCGERFGLTDALLLFAGSLTAFAFLVFAALFWLSEAALVRQDDEYLQELSGELSRHFQIEQEKVRSQIRDLEDYAARHPARSRHVDDILGKLKDAKVQVHYPFFDRAFFANLKGEVTTSFTIGKRHIPPPVVSERPYFRTVKDLQVSAVEPVNSWATGERLTVFAQPGKKDPQRVVALLIRTLSLERALLSPGYGFAVLDPEGNVLFHSDRRKAGFENFLAATGRRAPLDSIPFEADYDGKRHLLLARAPFSDLSKDWTLVVFHDQTAIRSALLKTLIRALIVFGIYMLLLTLFVQGVLHWKLRSEGLWIWSIRSLVRLGGRLLLLYLGATLLLVAAFHWLPLPSWLVWLLSLTPCILLILTVPRLVLRDLDGAVAVRTNLAALVLLQVLVAAVPAYGYYQEAFHRQIEELVKTAVRPADLARACEQQRKELRDTYEKRVGVEVDLARLLSCYKPASYEASWGPRNFTGDAPQWGRVGLAALALGLGFGVTTLLVLLASRRLFGAGPPQTPPAEGEQRILWLGPEGIGLPQNGGRARDLPYDEFMDEARLSQFLRRAHEQNIDRLVIPDFDADWRDAAENRRREAALQTLLGCWDKEIWLISEVAPEEFVWAPDSSKGTTEVPLTELLRNELKVVHKDDPEQVQALARSQPRRIWQSLTHQERWVLEQIVSHGFLHPDLRITVQELKWYGLLGPGLPPRIFDRGFASFVCERLARQKATVAPPAPGGWRTWRTLVTALVLIVLTILWLTQEGLFQKLTTSVGVISAALGAVLALGNFFRPQGSGGQS